MTIAELKQGRAEVARHAHNVKVAGSTPAPATSSPICSRCGYNMIADTPVKRDGWDINPNGAVSYRGQRLPMPQTWAQVLLSVARAGFIGRSALLDRISFTENDNVLSAQVCKLRRSLREQGVPDPIETIHGRGYAWASAA